MKPYVYIIQNKDRTHWYVGYKQKPKAREDYWGSSKYLKELIAQTGKENWTKTIIKEFDTWQEAKAHEDEILELMWDWPGRVNKARNGFIDLDDPEVKAKQKAGTQKREQDPVYRATREALYQDPEYRAKHQAGIEKRDSDLLYLEKKKAGVRKKLAKPFIATNIATGEEFYCESGYCDQVKVLGLEQSAISKFLNGSYPSTTYKGFTFRYT